MLQVCGSRARQRSVYVSETNRLEVVIMSSKLDDESVYFLLKYEGITSHVCFNDVNSNIIGMRCVWELNSSCVRVIRNNNMLLKND